MRDHYLVSADMNINTKSGLVLQGSKVKIRMFSESDINHTYISWLNDLEVVRFSNQRFLVHDRQSCMRYLASFNSTNNLFMSVNRISDDRPLGTITAYILKNHGTVDVGIMIGDKSSWGLGYGQDAWNTMTSWLLAHDDIRKLTAGTLKSNISMIKLMERSGMILEAVRKSQEIVNNMPMDILYYSKFNSS
jgi:[ribosomal protein S5]-alanine N-acetyltransferase